MSFQDFEWRMCLSKVLVDPFFLKHHEVGEAKEAHCFRSQWLSSDKRLNMYWKLNYDQRTTWFKELRLNVGISHSSEIKVTTYFLQIDPNMTIKGYSTLY